MKTEELSFFGLKSTIFNTIASKFSPQITQDWLNSFGFFMKKFPPHKKKIHHIKSDLKPNVIFQVISQMSLQWLKFIRFAVDIKKIQNKIKIIKMPTNDGNEMNA